MRVHTICSRCLTRHQVQRLLQFEQKAQSDTSMCTHALAQCETSLAESRAIHAQAVERVQQADGLRIRKQLELETNKDACVPAAEVQVIEKNLQSVAAGAKFYDDVPFLFVTPPPLRRPFHQCISFCRPRAFPQPHSTIARLQHKGQHCGAARARCG